MSQWMWVGGMTGMGVTFAFRFSKSERVAVVISVKEGNLVSEGWTKLWI